MNIKQRFIYKSSIGFSLGVLITILINVIISAIEGSGEVVNMYSDIHGGKTITLVMLELLTGGVLGLVGNGGSVVYEIEDWSIIKATSIHFVVTMIVYTIVGLFNGWLVPKHSIINVVQYGSMIFAYFMIWLIQYLVCKKSIDDINESVNYLKEGEKI